MKRFLLSLTVLPMFIALSLFIFPYLTIAENKPPYFVSEMWSGEGRPQLRAKTNLRLHAEPKRESPIINGSIAKGELVDFTETRQLTIEPIAITVDKDVDFPDALSYGNIKYLSVKDYYESGKPTLLKVMKGQEVKILQYRAEGDFLIEYKSIVYGAKCPICRSAMWPKTEWWVLVNRGALRGWLLVDKDVEDLR